MRSHVYFYSYNIPIPMNKSLLVTALSCSLAFYACTKTEDVVTKVTPPPIPVVIDTTHAPVKIDPAVVAAGLTVGHSAAGTTGTFPATSTDASAPKLDSVYNDLTYYTVNNRYVIIYPRSNSGFVQGYYVAINGSNSYFKVDYGTFNQLPARKKSRHLPTSLRENGGHEDSTIILKLPGNLVGDIFTVKYAAYDKENRVSNPITAIINIVASPNAGDDAKLLGNWKETGFRYDDEEWYTSYYWENTSTGYCLNDTIYPDQMAGATEIPNMVKNKERYENVYQFKANNAFRYAESYFYMDLDYENSSCSKLSYINDDYPDDYVDLGGYSYNATTRKITIIYDEGRYATNLSTYTYTVKEQTDSKIIMYSTSGSTNNVINTRRYYELTKQTK